MFRSLIIQSIKFEEIEQRIEAVTGDCLPNNFLGRCQTIASTIELTTLDVAESVFDHACGGISPSDRLAELEALL